MADDTPTADAVWNYLTGGGHELEDEDRKALEKYIADNPFPYDDEEARALWLASVPDLPHLPHDGREGRLFDEMVRHFITPSEELEWQRLREEDPNTPPLRAWHARRNGYRVPDGTS